MDRREYIIELAKPVIEQGEMSISFTIPTNSLRVTMPSGFNGWKAWRDLRNLCDMAMRIMDLHEQDIHPGEDREEEGKYCDLLLASIRLVEMERDGKANSAHWIALKKSICAIKGGSYIKYCVKG